MNKDQFDGLIALKLVSENKSFSAAAQILKVSPAAISKMVSQLEKRMGVTLLTRTTRTVSLTQAGETFLAQAGPAIQQIIDAQENAKDFGQKPRGILKLNMPGVFYPFYLSDVIDSFLKKYPEVTVDIYSDDQASDIFEKGFDAGIRPDDILAKDLFALKLFGPVEYVTVASPEYLKENGTPKHPKDLLNHNCIRHRFGTGSSIYEKWEYEENGKEFVVTISGNLVLNNSFAIRHAALSGSGVAFTELGNVQKDIKEGKLKRLLPKFEVESAGYYLYYPHKQNISSTLRAFIEHCKSSKIKLS